MKCEELKKAIPDLVMGHANPDAVERIEAHVAECAVCRQELEKMQIVWQDLVRLPEEEPSPALRSRFYTFLHEAKAEAREKARIRWSQKLESWIIGWWPRRPVVQFSFSLVLLAFGLIIGTQIQSGLHRNGEMASLRQEIRDMRQMVSVSLLNQPSPSERLKGVSFSSHVEEPTESLLSALLNTLNTDPNVNVRLAAVDALTLFSDQPGVREALVESLAQQASPLVQIAIIDLLVEIRERRALTALRKLIGDQDIDQTVRLHAQKSIEELI